MQARNTNEEKSRGLFSKIPETEKFILAAACLIKTQKRINISKEETFAVSKNCEKQNAM